jgi:hypothetical protein
LFMEVYHMWVKVNFTNDNVNIDEMDMDEWGWKFITWQITISMLTKITSNEIQFHAWNWPNEKNCNTMCEIICIDQNDHHSNACLYSSETCIPNSLPCIFINYFLDCKLFSRANSFHVATCTQIEKWFKNTIIWKFDNYFSLLPINYIWSKPLSNVPKLNFFVNDHPK